MNSRQLSWLALIMLGVGWGLAVPLTRIAVSTGHGHFGLIFWQIVFSGTVLAVLAYTGGRRRRIRPLTRPRLAVCVVIALAGTVIPNTFSYQAAVHLPAGVMAIIISLVPMFALPLAVCIGIERLRLVRVAGIACGAVSIGLLLGPDTSLPDPAVSVFVLVAMVAPLCYGVEGTFVGKFGLAGLNPVEALFWSSVIGLFIAVPLALASGQWIDLIRPWGDAEFALLSLSILHALCYAGYVWLVGHAGTVFAAQASYLVTGCGVFWSIVLLGESYSGWVWGSMLLMTAGLILVQPRSAPGEPGAMGAPGRQRARNSAGRVKRGRSRE